MACVVSGKILAAGTDSAATQTLDIHGAPKHDAPKVELAAMRLTMIARRVPCDRSTLEYELVTDVPPWLQNV